MRLRKYNHRDSEGLDNHRFLSTEISYSPVVAAAGFSAAVMQIVLLRELMVLFYGIELCIGAVLAVWLLASALGCRLSIGFSPSKWLVCGLALAEALILPCTLLLIRASSHIWGLVPGDIPPLSSLLQICLAAVFPIASVSGALFGLCWFFSEKSGANPMNIYAGEALGATAGGLFFYFLVLTHQPTLAIVLLASLALVPAITLACRGAAVDPLHRICLPMAGVLAVILFAVFLFLEKLDQTSHRWQWGTDFLAAEDTPYQNLIIVHRKGQFSVFANGLWRFSYPDRRSVEWAVHPALLQHPDPRSVLVLGGIPEGLPEEILRHPSVRRVNAVELDPALVTFTAAYLSDKHAVTSARAEVRVHYQDAATFLRSDRQHYDVILMNMGDPINAQLNRFYTTSFFTAVKSHLTPSGIFSFDVSGGGEMLGEVQNQFLGGIYRTLGRIFPAVSVLPGDRVRFFAADGDTALIDDPLLLSLRIQQRGLDLSYVRRDTLQDSFETFRMQYFKGVLQDAPADRINKDFTPLCYTHALRLWAQQWHPLLGKTVRLLTRIPPKLLWFCFLLVCMIFLGVFTIGKSKAPRAVCLSVAVVGGLCMATQMGMLIVFQILKGALFLHLALIVSLFMAGLAGGAAWMSQKTLRNGKKRQAGRRLVRVQVLICILPCLLAALFLLLHGPLRTAADSNLSVLLFPMLSFTSGLLGGIHFSTATAVMAELGHPLSAVGGRLYAFDLLGSAGGLLAATFLLIPVLGPVWMLPMFSIAALSSLWLLFAGLRQLG